MIFRQWWQVLDGSKTQTRRIVKANELASGSRGGGRPEIHAVWIDTRGTHDKRFEYHGFIRAPLVILEELYRLKWAVAQGFFVDKTYAVQPGRGKKAVGRFRLKGIRKEKVQDISEKDAIAEGMFKELHPISLKPVTRYMIFWNSIHKKAGTCWEDNPTVWVLDIERLNREEKT